MVLIVVQVYMAKFLPSTYLSNYIYEIWAMPHDPGRCNDMRQTSDCLRRRVGVCSVLEFAGLKDLTKMHIHSNSKVFSPVKVVIIAFDKHVFETGETIKD